MLSSDNASYSKLFILFDILSLSFMDLVFSCESLQCVFLAVTYESFFFLALVDSNGKQDL
jgi:hypothetical protein